MTAVILEDEKVAQRRLERIISDSFGEEIQILELFDSVKQLVDYLKDNPHPDILFLDILVSDGNSFDLFDHVDVESSVIFTTAYDEFAISAFRKNAVDYLLKPIKSSELVEAVNRTKDALDSEQAHYAVDLKPFKERFLIRFGSKLYSVKASQIAYIFSENKLSFFVLKDGKKIPSDFILQDLEDSLDKREFFRANRQFIVHIDSISEMVTHSKSRVILRLDPPSKEDVVVSTETTREFKNWLNR